MVASEIGVAIFIPVASTNENHFYGKSCGIAKTFYAYLHDMHDCLNYFSPAAQSIGKSRGDIEAFTIEMRGVKL
jgi:hypothetical protein